jgi:hypothetical protein
MGRKRGFMKKITKEQEKQVIQIYKQRPMTYEECAKLCGLSYCSIFKILKRNNIKPYSKNKLFSPNFQEDYFETIDSEDKAYFLGLIMTDGCISTTSSTKFVAIELKSNDNYILQKLLDCIGSTRKLTTDKRCDCMTATICGEKIVADLKKHGCKERSSLTQEFPTTIPDEMMRHFVRGLIDGDGSIGYYSVVKNGRVRNNHYKNIRMCSGNYNFLKDMMIYMNDRLGLKLNYEVIQKEKEHLYSFKYGNKHDLSLIIHWLYDDATIYLKRKKEICDKILAEIE